MRLLTVREFLTQQATTIGLSLIIAELFYKFHSFLLETSAFLVTWFVIDWVRQFVTNALTRHGGTGPSSNR
jgi:hypothetical protein